jgi:hypothetical protein
VQFAWDLQGNVANDANSAGRIVVVVNFQLRINVVEFFSHDFKSNEATSTESAFFNHPVLIRFSL